MVINPSEPASWPKVYQWLEDTFYEDDPNGNDSYIVEAWEAGGPASAVLLNSIIPDLIEDALLGGETSVAQLLEYVMAEIAKNLADNHESCFFYAFKLAGGIVLATGTETPVGPLLDWHGIVKSDEDILSMLTQRGVATSFFPLSDFVPVVADQIGEYLVGQIKRDHSYSIFGENEFEASVTISAYDHQAMLLNGPTTFDGIEYTDDGDLHCEVTIYPNERIDVRRAGLLLASSAIEDCYHSRLPPE